MQVFLVPVERQIWIMSARQRQIGGLKCQKG